MNTDIYIVPWLNDEAFSLDFLKQGAMSNPYSFLKECRYEMALNDLYTLESTCHYHEGMPYCPVILKISNKLKGKYRQETSYLLQVWSISHEKIYEVELQKPIKAWNIRFDYFIYKPEEPDVNHNFFHLINLTKINDKGQCSAQLVQDFVQNADYRYFSYVNSIFYIASSKEIQFFSLEDDVEIGETITVDRNRLEICRITRADLKDMPVHGLFSQSKDHKFILVALETHENQIDFNQLEVIRDIETESLTFKFKQHREIVSRAQVIIDPIAKFSQTIARTQDGYMAYAVALRKSGNADFYFNMSRVASYEVNSNQEANPDSQFDYTKKILDVECSFEQTFLNFGKIKRGQDLIRAINHKLEARVSLEETEIIDKYPFENIYYQRVKSYCKLFSAFVFAGTDIFVSHGKFLTQFDVQKKTIVDHISFDREIIDVFRAQDGLGGFDIVVILAKGLVKIVCKDQNGQRYEKREDIAAEMQQYIHGYYNQHDFDREENMYALIMTELDNKQRLYCYYQRQIFDVTTQMFQQSDTYYKLNDSCRLLFMFCEAPNSTRFIIQDQNSIQMFTIVMPKVDQKKEEEKLIRGGGLFGKNIEEEVQPVISRIWVISGLISLADSYYDNDTIDLNNTDLFSNFHSAISILDKNEKTAFKGQLQDEESIKKINEYFLFFDNSHIYMFIKRTNQFRLFENQNIQGLFFSDFNYLYTLSQKRQKKNIGSGFRIYDLWNFITTSDKDDLSYELTPVQVGSQCLIDFSVVNQRFVYQSSFDNLEVLPVLHRNSIFFMGMHERDFYLSTRVIEDKFIALDRTNQMTTWNIVTGKVDFEHPRRQLNDDSDYSGFEIYKYGPNDHGYEREWYSKTLLISQQEMPLSQEEESKFFNSDDLVTTLPKQIPYVQTLDKKYYKFKLIEIQNKKEVKEYASFIYPRWDGKTQYMYFNEDCSMMFEGLFLERYQIYKRVDIPGKKMCRWDLIRRLPNLPGNYFASISQYPFYLSPNFQNYLDIDITRKIFIIKDTEKQTVLKEIPSWLMNYEGESERKETLSRFKWRDNQHIQLVNHEGFEKVISVFDRTMSEVAFYNIPLYQKSAKHHYYDKPVIEIVDIVERLQRKYQSYKQSTLLDAQFSKATGKDRENLYQRLFTVDYQRVHQKDENKYDRFIIDQSFTFFHWSLMEQLSSGKLQVSQINEEQIQCLIYNILPQGRTALHLFQENSTVLDGLYGVCHKFNDQKKKLMTRMHIPFVQNFDNQSPLTLLIQKNNVRNVDKVLYNLQPYGIDHHSREIQDCFSYFVENKVPSLNLYLTSRVIRTQYLQGIDKGRVLQTPAQGISTASFWINDEDQNKLWGTGAGENDEQEKEIRVEYIDMTGPHTYSNEDSEKFFEALANCQDMTLFNEVAIRKMIDFKWVLAKKYTIRKLLTPYLAFMFVYLSYMNYFYLIRFNQGWYQYIDTLYVVILGLFSAYFVTMELKQLRNEGLVYLSSIWNYLDLIPPFTLAMFLPMEIMGFFDYQEKMNDYIARQRLANFLGQTLEDTTVTIRTIEGILQSVISLIIWLKLLYFLRIFKSTGYYIRTIIEVIMDIKYFLLMLLLTIVAFGDSMRQISESNTADNAFMGQNIFSAVGFVYRMVLGDFDTTQFGSVSVGYVWILFVICTLFNMIIMLNLLIAIISDSFSRITSVSTEAGYREMADLIAENTYLIPEDEKNQFCPDNKYLIIATDIQQEIGTLMSFDDQMEQVVQKIFTQTGDSQSKLLNKMGVSQRTSEELFIQKTKQINSNRDKIISLIDQLRAYNNANQRRF